MSDNILMRTFQEDLLYHFTLRSSYLFLVYMAYIRDDKWAICVRFIAPYFQLKKLAFLYLIRTYNGYLNIIKLW